MADPADNNFNDHPDDVVLYTENLAGNLHVVAHNITVRGLAEYVLHMESATGYSTIVVYRLKRHKLEHFKREGIFG